MCTTYFHDISRSQVTAWIYSSEWWKKVQMQFRNSPLASLVKKFWAQFHDWCVQKWSCLLLSSDTFRKFSPDEVYEESFGHIFTIYASKNEAVSCKVQTRDDKVQIRVQSLGRLLKVLKQFANKFFSDDVIPGQKIFVFCKVSKSNNEFFCCCSFHFTVMQTVRFTCFHSNQWTMLGITKAANTFIYSLLLMFMFRTSIPKHSLAMYPFSI